jgi:Ca-activated chloride channel homolog
MRLGPGLILLAVLLGRAAAQNSADRVEIVPRKQILRSGRPGADIRLDVEVVMVPVTVTDALDHPITDLSRERFRVLEDGREQTITSFVRNDAPVSLGLLFDSSGSMKNRIDASIAALRELFTTAIQGDEYFVVQFSNHAVLLGGFTSEPDEIFSRLGRVQAQGWTALLDAVALGTKTMRSARNRSRALLILSDGNDNNSRFTESEVRRMVVESDLRVYAIGIVSLPRLLKQLAQETGGKVLLVRNTGELPEVVERLSLEIRSQYLIGYTPGNRTSDGKYRTVRVELVQPAGSRPLQVSWRRGYYAPGY